MEQQAYVVLLSGGDADGAIMQDRDGRYAIFHSLNQAETFVQGMADNNVYPEGCGAFFIRIVTLDPVPQHAHLRRR